MAYAKRAYLSFKDWKDTSWTVEIYQDGYGGAAGEIVMGADPVVIRWGGDEWKNIVGSECILTILSSDDLSWLNTSNGLEIKVIIKKAGSAWWTGFALPNQYYDTLNYPRYFTLTASDRIGKLRDFEYVGADGFAYDGKDKALTCLAQALSNTGQELNLRSAINLFEDAMDEADTDDPLDQTDIDQDLFSDNDLNPGNCYDVVNYILKVFKARLFQSGNEWWVVRVPEYSGTAIDYRGYLYNSGNVEYDYSFNNSFDPAKATGTAFRLMRGSQIETIEPWEQLTVIKQFGKRETIIKGSNFPKLEFDGTTPRHFTISGTSSFEQKITSNTYGVRCDSFSGSVDTNKYIVSDGVVVEATTEQFLFKLRGGWYSREGYAYLKFWIDTGGTGYWYDGAIWRTTAQIISTQTTSFKIPTITGYSEPDEVEMVIDGIPGGGTLYIYFYDPNTATIQTTLYIESFWISHINTGNNYPDSEDEITVIDTDNEILAEYGVNLADKPSLYENNLIIYKGALQVNTDSSIAEAWHVKGVLGTTKTLSQWLADMVLADAAAPLLRFRGQIHGQADYFNTIQLTEYSDEKFAWEDVEYNIKKAMWEGSAVNLKGALLSASGTSTEAKSAASIGGSATNVTINNTTNNVLDYRAGSEAITAGGQVVAFGSVFVAAANYILGIQSCLDASGNPVQYTISANDQDGFTINTMRDATVKYLAFKIT